MTCKWVSGCGGGGASAHAPAIVFETGGIARCGDGTFALCGPSTSAPAPTTTRTNDVREVSDTGGTTARRTPDARQTTTTGPDPVEPVRTSARSHTVQFAKDSSEISAEQRAALRTWIMSLISDPALRGAPAESTGSTTPMPLGKITHFYATGHASTEGSTDYNQALSDRRAQAVYESITQILAAELPGSGRIRVEATAVGEREPIGDPESETDRARSRRVTITTNEV